MTIGMGVSVVVNGGKNRVVQARTVRKDGWTEARREGFLLALSMTANVTTAAASVGITGSGAHALRRREPGFAVLWGEALASGYDRLEEALLMGALARLQGDPDGAGLEGADAGTGAGADERCAGGLEGAGEDPPAKTVSGAAMAASDAAVLPGPIPGSGVVHLAGFQAVQVGLAMLARFRAAQTGGRGKLPQHRRATVAETNASIAKKLDSLAQRLRASSVEGEA